MKINVNGIEIETERKSIVNDEKINDDKFIHSFIKSLTQEEKEKLKSLLSD